MSDSNSLSNRSVTQSSIRAAHPNPASWRQVLKNAMEQSTWFRNRRGQASRHSSERLRGFLLSLRNRKYWIASLFFILGALIVFGIIRFATLPSTLKVKNPVASGKSVPGLSASAKPKPAPGKPFVPVTQTHLPIPTVWTPVAPTQQTPSTTVVPQVPTTAMTAPAPAPPLASAPPPPVVSTKSSSMPPLVYTARHDKHFGGSCSGQLTLSTTGLTFHCPDDPSGSVEVALNQIGAVDENGVLLLSGKKYHFSIPGMSKSAEQQLFVNWLHQVR